MICPNCGSQQVFVADSRERDGIRHRRYNCLDCNGYFHSIETIVEGSWRKRRKRK